MVAYPLTGAAGPYTEFNLASTFRRVALTSVLTAMLFLIAPPARPDPHEKTVKDTGAHTHLIGRK
jgi:hypothetical protein